MAGEKQPGIASRDLPGIRWIGWSRAITALLVTMAWSSMASAGTPGEGWFRTPIGGLIPIPSTRSDLALGDIDGDNDIDAVLSYFASDPNLVYYNGGNGVLSNGQNAFGSAATEAIILVDVDGDNDLDAVTATAAGSADEIWLNNGLGEFTLSSVTLPATASARVEALDLDGDLDADLVFGKETGALGVFINQGGLQLGTTGNFAAGQVIAAPMPNMPVRDLATPDLDDDGLPDLAALYPDQLLIFPNAAGTFGTPQSITTANATSIAFGRLNNDSLPDFVLGDAFFDTGATWFLADGLGGFNTVSRALPDGFVFDLVLADFDGDNEDDIAAAAVPPSLFLPSLESRVQTWLNFGSGVDFIATTQCLSSGVDDVNDLKSADMDGDGDPDLVLLVDSMPPQLVVYLNGPSGLVEVCCPAEATFFLTGSTGEVSGIQAPEGATDSFYLSTLRRLRDEVMANRLDGIRLIDDYQSLGDDMLAVFAQDFLLMFSSSALLTLWEPNFQALLDGNGGNVTITAEQINPISFLLDDFVNQGSPELVQVINAERARLSPLSQYVGMDMNSFADVVFGADDVIFRDSLETQP